MTGLPELGRRDVMSFFPLAAPRPSQVNVIRAIDKVFSSGTKVVVLEAPVGSGKSAIAVTLARAYGSAHILTPRKALQRQYLDDFKGMAMMQGKGNYPCTYGKSDAFYQACKEVSEGQDLGGWLGWDKFRTVSKGWCVKRGKKNRTKYESCRYDLLGSDALAEEEHCPFEFAIRFAIQNSIIVHNLHSFLYQNYFGKYFGGRELLVIDEAHELEGLIRGFVTSSFVYPKNLPFRAPEEEDEVSAWVEFLSQDRVAPTGMGGEADAEKREKWLEKLAFMLEVEDTFLKNRLTIVEEVNDTQMKVQFIPETFGKAPADLFFDYGKRVLLMSGTIYDKEYYCRKLGLKPDEVAFIRLTSEFPVGTRPIVMSKRWMTDNSHRSWRDTPSEYLDLVNNLKELMEENPDTKGLIHAPSYHIARDLAMKLGDRVIPHSAEDFQVQLDKFYQCTENSVFISPVCQQGVDMKYDRARWQAIIRVPYPGMEDPFVSRMSKKDFQWYNYQSLIAFGQMTGRINRGPDDFGVTYLLDSRFPAYLRKNSKLLPKWLLDAVETR
jgi:Rad3-related DNA helicase